MKITKLKQLKYNPTMENLTKVSETCDRVNDIGWKFFGFIINIANCKWIEICKNQYKLK